MSDEAMPVDNPRGPLGVRLSPAEEEMLEQLIELRQKELASLGVRAPKVTRASVLRDALHYFAKVRLIGTHAWIDPPAEPPQKGLPTTHNGLEWISAPYRMAAALSPEAKAILGKLLLPSSDLALLGAGLLTGGFAFPEATAPVAQKRLEELGELERETPPKLLDPKEVHRALVEALSTWTQKEVAERAQVSPQKISKFYLGVRQLKEDELRRLWTWLQKKETGP